MSYFAAWKFRCIFRAPGAVFKERGPVTTSFEVEAGQGRVGANLAVLSLWLFRTVRLLNLSLVLVERSHVFKFQAAEKYLSPAEPDCTCRIHQQKFTMQVPVTPSFCLVCHRNASKTTSSPDIIRFKKPQFVEQSSNLIENRHKKKTTQPCLFENAEVQDQVQFCEHRCFESYYRGIRLMGSKRNLDAGRFSFQQRYYLCENVYYSGTSITKSSV